jgi:hypothetical protein
MLTTGTGLDGKMNLAKQNFRTGKSSVQITFRWMECKMKDCVMMKDGQMMVMKDGQTMNMEKDMTLSNGTMVMMDGSMKMKNGKKMMMKNGDIMSMDRKMTKMKMDKSMQKM